MFSTFFINRPIFATVLSILIVIAGLVSLRSLPVEQYPTITPPTVVVRASYPGANASTIADMVGTPIEQQVNGVEGMLYMSSTSSSTGSYQLTITFEVGTDLDMATVLVENRVNMALSTLPQEVTQIGVTTTKESTNVVMFLSLTSDSPQYDALFLSNYAALNITNELGRVKGVGNVGLFGMGKYSMRIWLDPDQLTIRGITPADIVSAIQGQNIQVTAGSVGSEPLVRKEAYQYTLETKGLLIDEEEFGNIIVKALPDGKYLRIRDLATIELGRESYSSTATLKGGAVAAIAVYQLPGANALDVAQRVKKEMDKLASYFPEGVQYSVTLDTDGIYQCLAFQNIRTLITAFILVLLAYSDLPPKLAGDADSADHDSRLAGRDFHLHGDAGIFHQYADSLRTGTGYRAGSRRRHYHRRKQLPADRNRPVSHRKRGGDPGHEGSVGSCCGYCARTVGRIYSHGLYRRHHRPVVQTIRPDDRHLDGNQRVQRPHPEPRTLCPVSETQTAGQILSLQSFQPVF